MLVFALQVLKVRQNWNQDPRLVQGKQCKQAKEDAPPSLLSSAGLCHVKKDRNTLHRVQRRATGMLERLKHLTREESLRDFMQPGEDKSLGGYYPSV